MNKNFSTLMGDARGKLKDLGKKKSFKLLKKWLIVEDSFEKKNSI